MVRVEFKCTDCGEVQPLTEVNIANGIWAVCRKCNKGQKVNNEFTSAIALDIATRIKCTDTNCLKYLKIMKVLSEVAIQKQLNNNGILLSNSELNFLNTLITMLKEA